MQLTLSVDLSVSIGGRGGGYILLVRRVRIHDWKVMWRTGQSRSGEPFERILTVQTLNGVTDSGV